MDKILNRLNKIQKAIEGLKNQNEALLNGKQKADKEIERLKQLVAIQNNSIKEFEQKLKIKEISEGVLSNEKLSVNKRRELKHKINEMIKEVDKVIAIIN